jgi:hypothetical protein
MAEVVDVHVLFCGQGMTNWIEYYANEGDKNNKKPSMTAIVDLGGSARSGKAAPQFIVDRLKQFEASCRKITALVYSHRDGDHWNLTDLFARLLQAQCPEATIGEIWKGGTGWSAKAKKSIKKLATATGCPADKNKFFEGFRSDYETPGHLIRQGGCQIRVVAVNVPAATVTEMDEGPGPGPGPGPDPDFAAAAIAGMRAAQAVGGEEANRTSAVIAIELGNLSIILPGDATQETMARVSQVYEGPQKPKPCYGMSIPHHGALRTSVDAYVAGDKKLQKTTFVTLDNFIKSTSPKQVVASSGTDNKHHHPLQQIMDRFATTIDKTKNIGEHYLQVWDYVKSSGAPVRPPPGMTTPISTTSAYEKIDPPPGPPPPLAGDQPPPAKKRKGEDAKAILVAKPTFKPKPQNIVFTIDSAGGAMVSFLPVRPRASPPRPAAGATAAAPTDAELAAHARRTSGAAG